MVWLRARKRLRGGAVESLTELIRKVLAGAYHHGLCPEHVDAGGSAKTESNAYKTSVGLGGVIFVHSGKIKVPFL